ncbi:MAG TPA: MogA/MoaB family molybdenum cofactor biosynthesis protein [Bryobacteraceae bacterium]|nr:MogA/MoaB family molybdenum cofactor biosynthesis protein [Bryobacteraceae bacterium]
MSLQVAIVTISDTASAGTREDRSGPALAQRALELGWTVAKRAMVPDDRTLIAKTVVNLCGCDVVLTTGGTGLAPRDVTPEAMKMIAEREVPGFGELMRAEGLKSTKFAPLSRGGAVTRGSALIVMLPGSPRGALESLNAVADLIPHVVDLLHGRTEHKEKLGASS